MVGPLPAGTGQAEDEATAPGLIQSFASLSKIFKLLPLDKITLSLHQLTNSYHIPSSSLKTYKTQHPFQPRSQLPSNPDPTIYPAQHILSLSILTMTSVSTLSGPALQASRAAISAALADQSSADSTVDEATLEPGEIQEVDMQAQAEGIKTVFNDPTNFNVKVSSHLV